MTVPFSEGTTMCRTPHAKLEGRPLFGWAARRPWRTHCAPSPPLVVGAAQARSGTASTVAEQGSGKQHSRTGAGPQAAAVAAAAAAAAAAAGERLQQAGSSSRARVPATQLQEQVEILCHYFKQTDPRRVRIPLRRAVAALREYEPGREQLSLEDDILPKVELLEALSEGLGWKVFARYPAQLAHPNATEYWRILAAYLYTSGFTPQKISALFTQHPCLFARVVDDPDSTRCLFEWLRELGLDQKGVVRLLDRVPLLLQMDTERVLQPRLQYLLDLPMPLPKALAAIRRQPELLAVDSEVLQERIDYLKGLGITQTQLAAMLARDPSAFVSSIQQKLEPMVALLQEELGCDKGLVCKLLTKGGLFSRSLGTVQERLAYWRDDAGFGAAALQRMLNRFPRLLLFNMSEPKHQAKLEFLQGTLGQPLSCLETYPQYVSYSLEQRIIPRAAAAERLASERQLALSQLATSDAAFCKHYGICPEAYSRFLKALQSGLDVDAATAAAKQQPGGAP